jgi:hypothetical protein
MSNSYKPVLTLSMDEKIYLAVAKRDLDKLAFVYTLACLKSDKNANTYDCFATQEIHTFKSKTSADVYYETVSQIVEINENDEEKKFLFDTNEKLIEKFIEKTK